MRGVKDVAPYALISKLHLAPPLSTKLSVLVEKVLIFLIENEKSLNICNQKLRKVTFSSCIMDKMGV